MSERVLPQQTETIISQCVCLWQQWTTTGTNAVSGETPASLTKTNGCKNAHRDSHVHTHTYMQLIHRGLSNTLWYGPLASVMKLNSWQNDVNNSHSHSVRKWFQQMSEKMPSIKPPQVMLIGVSECDFIFFLPKLHLPFLPIHCKRFLTFIITAQRMCNMWMAVLGFTSAVKCFMKVFRVETRV